MSVNSVTICEGEDPGPEEIPAHMERFVRNMHQTYAPQFNWVQSQVKDLPSYNLLEGGIPGNYIRSKAPINGHYIWFDPNDPTKPPFIPKDEYLDTW